MRFQPSPSRGAVRLRAVPTPPDHSGRGLSARAARTAPRSTSNPGRPAANDPRWVLARRTAEQLQGSILVPERRARLLHLGRALKLNDFDANLVIAIVQDQARRGVPPQWCPAVGARQLAMLSAPAVSSDSPDSPPTPVTVNAEPRGRRALRLAGWLTVALAMELLILYWIV
jgi:hypothetical protein